MITKLPKKTVVMIGGGLTAGLAARQLTNKHIEVLVLERGERLLIILVGVMLPLGIALGVSLALSNATQERAVQQQCNQQAEERRHQHDDNDQDNGVESHPPELAVLNHRDVVVQPHELT